LKQVGHIDFLILDEINIMGIIIAMDKKITGTFAGEYLKIKPFLYENKNSKPVVKEESLDPQIGRN
jgi:hypothetical protein